MMRLFCLMVSALMLGGASRPPEAIEPKPGLPFRLCVLDQLLILKVARIAVDQAARFQKLRGQAQTKLDDDQQAWTRDSRAFSDERRSLTASIAADRQQMLDRRRRDLDARVAQLNIYLNQLDVELTNAVMKSVTPAILAVMADRGCTVLSAKSAFLAIGDPSIDITQAVIARSNAAIENR